MPKVAQRLLDPEKLALLFDDFCQAFLHFDNKKEVKDFLFDLLTHTERKMLSKRFQIALLLIEKHSYQEIEDALDVSANTVANVNNRLSTVAYTLKEVAKKMIDPPDSSSKKETKRYIAGNLLAPAIEEGLNLAVRQISKKRHKDRRKQITKKTKP